ncbi:hypothetical protein ED733_003394 [Metarhizium rileyi]|uniref:Uncharacterized protein n=1 Tax=Metarhizium rileyi (strain RCEF 4871) TaxID=1649241 RepID=A0A5C6G6Q2_METRR|nr:hypothetical protein ED733_003394 [Metarhizium rileyi]
MQLIQILLAAAALAVLAWATPAPPAFEYNGTDFLLHGKLLVIVGGQMDPQRIPYDYWERRLIAAKGMGINTIFSYTFWNELQPEKDGWTGEEPANNITGFVNLAKEQGLYVVLRPGPYVGVERDWGGFPYWLSQVPDLEVRSNNKPFLKAVRDYLTQLAKDLAPLQISKGGNIIMFEVENDYSAYSTDRKYKKAIRSILNSLFEVPLYVTELGGRFFFEGTASSPMSSVADRELSVQDEPTTRNTSVISRLDREVRIAQADRWGPREQHHSQLNQSDLMESYIRTVNTNLSANKSLSFHMLHGGTNFGLTTGSVNTDGKTSPWANSYDHGAPIDEAGRTTPLYHALRAEILKYLPDKSQVPEPPKDLPLMKIPDIQLTPYATLFHTVTRTSKHEFPVYMESLEQAYGLILYEHITTLSVEGVLRVGDRPRDRVIVYVNGQRKGIIDSFHEHPATIRLSLRPGDTLQLLVENAGRTSYWHKDSNEPNLLMDPFKGVGGTVTVAGYVLKRWKISQIPCKEPPLLKKVIGGSIQKGIMPVYYSGKFKVPALREEQFWSELDTYLSIEGGTRGMVWVNGFHLGRYWIVGPQQSLYLPGILLKPGFTNKITVLEMKPWNATMVARGETTRRWENHPDPDAPQ